MNKTWTEMEKQYIRENAGIIKDSEVAAKLTEITGRKISIQSLRKQRQKLGLLKASGRGFCKLKDKSILSDKSITKPFPAPVTAVPESTTVSESTTVPDEFNPTPTDSVVTSVV